MIFQQIVKRNSRLVHENATLKLQIQHLIQKGDKFKSDSKKLETDKIDPKTIDKLMERNREVHRVQNLQKNSSS